MSESEKDAGKAEKSVKDLAPKADQVKGGKNASPMDPLINTSGRNGK